VEDPQDSRGPSEGSTNGAALPTNAFEGTGHRNLDPFRSQRAVNSSMALAVEVDIHAFCSHSTRYAYLWSTGAVRSFYTGCSPDHSHTGQTLWLTRPVLAAAVLAAVVSAVLAVVLAFSAMRSP